MLPLVKPFSKASDAEKKLLIVAEGFELRTLSALKTLTENVMFERVIICHYEPSKHSRYNELLRLVKLHTRKEPIYLKYNRFEPTSFEIELRSLFTEFNCYEDVYVDISVMSKLLIMIIINELKHFTNTVHLLYSEPVKWGPSKQQYDKAMSARKEGSAICLSSVGIGDIVRTPALSSVVMQKNPVVLVAGLSFNEQIVNILVNEISPEKLYLINQGCQRDLWREKAIEDIHQDIIEEYRNQKDVIRKFLLTEYDKVFDYLVDIYKKYWLTNRIIISPTGYKMHAISFALIKICCPDIHVEYPTPDSYLFDGYSSDEVECIYEIQFESFSDYINRIKENYKLDG